MTRTQLKDLAKLLTYASFDDPEDALAIVSRIVGGSGVEQVISPQGDTLFYVNRGDPYLDTVCWSAEADYTVDSWGGWLEIKEEKYAETTGRVKCGHCGHWTPVVGGDWQTTPCEACHKLVGG